MAIEIAHERTCYDPYIIWDVCVTGSHWWFNKTYTLDFRLLGLPIEEWLFFITVPFGCLLVWETLPAPKLSTPLRSLRYVRTVLYATVPIGIIVFSTGKQYTGLVLCCLGLVGLADTLLRTHLLLRPKTYLYLAIVAGLILVFNGYLTARPVVLYGEAYQSGYRILTIPLEDFGYGFTLTLFNAILYVFLNIRFPLAFVRCPKAVCYENNTTGKSYSEMEPF